LPIVQHELLCVINKVDQQLLNEGVEFLAVMADLMVSLIDRDLLAFLLAPTELRGVDVTFGSLACRA
jgi:hypothetical protein